MPSADVECDSRCPTVGGYGCVAWCGECIRPAVLLAQQPSGLSGAVGVKAERTLVAKRGSYIIPVAVAWTAQQYATVMVVSATAAYEKAGLVRWVSQEVDGGRGPMRWVKSSLRNKRCGGWRCLRESY